MIQEQEISIEPIEQQEIEPTNVLIKNKAKLLLKEDEFLRQEAEKWKDWVDIKTSELSNR